MQVLRFSQTPQISNSGARAAVWSSVVSRWFACALRLRTTGPYNRGPIVCTGGQELLLFNNSSLMYQ